MWGCFRRRRRVSEKPCRCLCRRHLPGRSGRRGRRIPSRRCRNLSGRREHQTVSRRSVALTARRRRSGPGLWSLKLQTAASKLRPRCILFSRRVQRTMLFSSRSVKYDPQIIAATRAQGCVCLFKLFPPTSCTQVNPVRLSLPVVNPETLVAGCYEKTTNLARHLFLFANVITLRTLRTARCMDRFPVRANNH